MLVTINTDASFNSQMKIGGYAFWIASDSGRITRSGVLKEAVNPTDAEIRCIANALACLYNQNYPVIKKIIINSDALTAFTKISPTAKPGSPELACYEMILKFRKRYMENPNDKRDIHQFRHVKAHTHTAKSRNWVNDWCDKEARKEMRKQVKSLRKI